MSTKAELHKKVDGLTQKIAGLRGEMESLRGEEKTIRARMIASKVADGKVETAVNEAAHDLRENLTRQDILGEAIRVLESQLKEPQQQLIDLDLAEKTIPWQELESDLWPAIAAMQMQVAEMNQKIVSLHARASQTPAFSADAVPLRNQLPLLLHEVNNGFYRAWQALEALTQRGPKRVYWPENDGVPGFGKKL